MIETPDLDSFTLGFADGWHGRPRKTRQGGVYLRAYAKGREERARFQVDSTEPGSVVSRGVRRAKAQRLP